jgi:hypothetical protein
MGCLHASPIETGNHDVLLGGNGNGANAVAPLSDPLDTSAPAFAGDRAVTDPKAHRLSAPEDSVLSRGQEIQLLPL